MSLYNLKMQLTIAILRFMRLKTKLLFLQAPISQTFLLEGRSPLGKTIELHNHLELHLIAVVAISLQNLLHLFIKVLVKPVLILLFCLAFITTILLLQIAVMLQFLTLVQIILLLKIILIHLSILLPFTIPIISQSKPHSQNRFQYKNPKRFQQQKIKSIHSQLIQINSKMQNKINLLDAFNVFHPQPTIPRQKKGFADDYMIYIYMQNDLPVNLCSIIAIDIKTYEDKGHDLAHYKDANILIDLILSQIFASYTAGNLSMIIKYAYILLPSYYFSCSHYHKSPKNLHLTKGQFLKQVKKKSFLVWWNSFSLSISHIYPQGQGTYLKIFRLIMQFYSQLQKSKLLYMQAVDQEFFQGYIRLLSIYTYSILISAKNIRRLSQATSPQEISKKKEVCYSSHLLKQNRHKVLHLKSVLSTSAENSRIANLLAKNMDHLL